MHAPLSHVGKRRTALVSTALAAALLLTALMPGSAEARSSFQYRESGRAAQTSWIQVDEGVEPGTAPFGNVHVGYLDVREIRKGVGEAWGEIADFDCEPGQLPDHGGHHAFDDEEPEPGDGCVHVGYRWIEGSNLAFTVDKKLTNATLKGRLTVYGGAHGEEGPVGTPMADIVWTGEGATWSSRFSETYTDGNWTYTYRGTYTGRNAAMGGQIGPMGFDPELSEGSIREYRVSERGRTR